MIRKWTLLSLSLLFFLLINPVLAEVKQPPAAELYRLNETLWSFSRNTNEDPLEIRISTPGFDNRSADYILAGLVANAAQQANSVSTLISQKLDFSNDKNLPSSLQKNWKLVDITKKWYDHFDNFFGSNPTPQGVIVIKIRQASLLKRNFSFIKRLFQADKDEGWRPNRLSIVWREDDWQKRLLETGLFQDPFTLLATKALQTDESPFVSEKECRGTYQFLLRNDQLSLERIDEKSSFLEAKAAIEAYRRYLKQTFAWRILDGLEGVFEQQLNNYGSIFKDVKNQEEQLFGYLKCSFGIDFDDLIKNEKPLLADHVFKCNIAVNNIEMPLLESLFLRISRLLKGATFSEDAILETGPQFFDFLKKEKLTSHFSLREILGIYHSFKKFSQASPLTSGSFRGYLNGFKFIQDLEQPGHGEKVRDLTPEAFHRLMEILLVDTDLIDPAIDSKGKPERFFTGRKIVHLGICGYKTMGDKKEFDPCRNLFELLHIYPRLARANEATFNELLATVVVKKSLWSSYPIRSKDNALEESNHRERRVARLIPFPDLKSEKRWYYVDGLLNDGRGDFNYVLVPACKGYLALGEGHPTINKQSPMIKLYRSTASDSEAESSIDSLLADTNPKKIGSLDFTAGDEYEMTYFGRCTMPTWVAYLILGNIDTAVEAFQSVKLHTSHVKSSLQEKLYLLLQFMVWQKFQIHEQDPALLKQEMQQILDRFIDKVGREAFERYLTQSIQGMEWEKQKIAQDIYYIGHSLGGALSQSGMYHFGPEQARIPLWGCNYKCIVYDTPGVTNHEASHFVQFGRKHTALLLSLNQCWEIQYQFEYGDLVPQGGQCFLGVADYIDKLDEPWLKISAFLCKPRNTTRDIVLTTISIHNHRFNQAQRSIDYEEKPLQIAELSRLKSGWTLPSSLRRKFGYEWTVPRINDTLRRTLPGTFAFAYYWTKKQAESLFSSHNPETDKNGILFCTYKGRGKASGYANEVSYPQDLVSLLQTSERQRLELSDYSPK